MNKLKYPPSIDWEITSSCNHNCIHCYNYWRKTVPDNTQNPTRDRFLKIAQRIVQEKPVSVQITGGEPFLMWQEFFEALALLVNTGINVSFNTNATLVTPEIAQYLADNNIDVFLSFPCARADIFDEIVGKKGAYKNALQGIKTLVEHKVRISPNMVVTNINFPYIFETAKFLKEKFNIKYFSATKASFPQNADNLFKKELLSLEKFNEMIDVLLYIKKELNIRVDSAWVYSLCGFNNEYSAKNFGLNRKCGCGRYNFVIDFNGDIKACGCDSKTYGNILDVSFEAAISNMSSWQDGSLLPNECKQCKLLLVCGGGCRADACSFNGTANALDSTSNPKNKPNDFFKDYKIEKFSLTQCFMIKEDVNFVEENEMIRMSFKTNFEFISYGFFNFLKQNKFFTTADLLNFSSENSDFVNNCIHILMKKGFIVLSEEALNNNIINADLPFKLFVSPYTDDNMPKYQGAYSGSFFLAKRFF